ncbi:ImmA/IrrE family metallo-endopeptidase [Mesorhizobium sp. M0904]|uniref:ImmA/IrrE family metallo-endopeptidase n=1 Tax=Mesorhizobium sp. M0904 TaxID=2957022 RepID=UPI0033372AA9
MKSLDRFNSEKLNELEIAERARTFRRTFGISEQLYVDIIEILEFRLKEIFPDFKLMIRRDVELDRTAHATNDPPRIFVRETIYDGACDGDQECRRILAHELGHLLLHAHIEGAKQRDLLGYSPQFENMNSLSSIEDQADIFARNFLVPPFIAFEHRRDIQKLSRVTGAPMNIASAAALISKRIEMLKIRQPPRTRQ